MSEPTKMYLAHFGFQALSLWHPDSPVPAFCSSMELSPCGEYVQLQRRRLDDQGYETLRQSVTRFWQPTQAQAYAAVAPRLRQMGERLVRQADELEQAALDELRDRPALAAAAAHDSGMGRPSGGGE